MKTFAISTGDGTATVYCYTATGDEARPAVIILHGRQGLEPFRSHYQRYAATLAQAGIDAFLVDYYSGDDAPLANNSNADQRRAFFAGRVRGWSRLISAVTDKISAGPDASRRIGLLGFSQGGFLATAAASQDHRVKALAVFYGGIPNAIGNEITNLPPLLELHGDSDQTVPLSQGRALVELARRVGQPAEMVVYPGAGHGFTGADDADAKRRVLDFFARRLTSAG